MNLLNNGLIQNLIGSDIPRLCRSIPELVSVLSVLCLEIRALREVLEKGQLQDDDDE